MKQIEDATLDLLNEKPIESITVDEIVTRAHVSKATIFKYYESKENLLITVIIDSFQRVYEKYEEIVNSPKPFEQTYKEITDLKMHEIMKHSPQFVKNTLTQFEEDNDFLSDQMNTSDDIMKKLFAKGRNEGKINPAYSEETVLLWQHVFIEGIRSISHDLDLITRHLPVMTQMFLNSLR